LDAVLRGALVCLSIFGMPGGRRGPSSQSHRIAHRFFALAERELRRMLKDAQQVLLI
jgi:hypothetical protein